MTKVLILLFLTTISITGSASCIEEGTAFLYGCVETQDAKQDLVCREQYGDDYLSYVEQDSCTQEWASYFRGEAKLPSVKKIEISDETVSCFTYTKGTQRECEIIQDVDADNFCAAKFGYKYLPFHASSECSSESADKDFGYASFDEVTDSLNEMLTQTESIMFMIDREDIRESLGGLISLKPIIGNEFYSPVMKGVLSKLKIIQTELKKRSQYKIDFSNPEGAELVKFAFRYLSLTNRVHKVYAHVAHKNHNELSSYSFNNLDFLNLIVSKTVGLEIISKLNLNIRNLDNDMVMFTQLEQSKQVYEYNALSNPKSKEDYAKLVSFMGLRENLTNYWALDKISEKSLLNKRYNNYGDFLSFRKSNIGELSQLATIRENLEFDAFYNDYLPRTQELIKLTREYNILDSSVALSALKNVLSSHEELKNYLVTSIEQTAKDLLPIYTQAEQLDWEVFSSQHFRSIVLPGDGVLSIERIADIITQKTFERRVLAIKNMFEGTYAFMPEKELKELSKNLESELNAMLKIKFELKLKSKLVKALANYTDRETFAQENYDSKVQDALEIIKKNVKIGSQYLDFDTKHRANPNIRPRSYDELVFLFENKISNKFMDIKKTLEEDEQLAAGLAEFFNKIAQSFNEKFLVQNSPGSYELTGTDEQRSDALVQILFDTAREYYLENNFEISQSAMVPEAAILAREEERQELTNSPYMIPIYRDGTPVVLHINELYKTFQQPVELVLSDTQVNMRVMSIMGLDFIDNTQKRNIKDKYTDGTFDQPNSYIYSNGEVFYENVDGSIALSTLKKLYLNSLDYTKKEIKENYSDQEKAKHFEQLAKKENMKDVPVIKTSQKLFARVFELYGIPAGSIINNISIENFVLSHADQKALAENVLTKAYAANPVTRFEIRTQEDKEVWVTPRSDFQVPHVMVTKRNVERSILLKAAYHAYDSQSDTLDEGLALSYIEKAIKRARLNISNNLGSFMNLDYLHIKENAKLRKAFKASSFLRTTLKSPTGTSIANAKRISEFDEQISKDIRTKMDALNEDYLEPALLISGGIALTIMMVMLAVGSLGTAVPAIFSLLITAEFILSAPVVATSLAIRLNSGFYEQPAQLQFQKSIAHSQITTSKITDYENIKEVEDSLRMTQIISIGLMPLDIFYGKMLVSHIRKEAGYHAIKAYQKLTNVKIKKYSAPASILSKNASFNNFRKEFGNLKGVYKYVTYSVNSLKRHLPKYHSLPNELVDSNILRVGLVNAIKRLKFQNTHPWLILDDIKHYSGQLKEKITKTHKVIQAERNLIAQIENRQIVDVNKVLDLKAHHNKFSYTVRAGWKAIKEKRFISYLRNFKSVRKEMLYLEENLLKNKVLKVEEMISSLESLKRELGVNGLKLSKFDARNTQEIINSLDQAQLQLLREVISKSNYGFKSLKKVYSQFDEISGGRYFVPTSYLHGHIDENFKAPLYKNSESLGTSHYQPVFKSDSEELVHFYETLIQQNGFKDKKTNELREGIESLVSELFTLDSQGARIYKKL